MDLHELTIFNLAKGNHKRAADGVCLMEAVAWMEGEKHSDKPECACPVIGRFAIGINDRLPDEWRQRLVPFIPRLVGTRSKIHERERAEFLAWQAIRVFAPLALDAAKLPFWAGKLRAFKGTLVEAQILARGARDAATAAAYAATAAAYAATAAAADAATAAATAAAYDAADAAVYAASATHASRLDQAHHIVDRFYELTGLQEGQAPDTEITEAAVCKMLEATA
jgi:hypothetical protein